MAAIGDDANHDRISLDGRDNNQDGGQDAVGVSGVAQAIVTTSSSSNTTTTQPIQTNAQFPTNYAHTQVNGSQNGHNNMNYGQPQMNGCQPMQMNGQFQPNYHNYANNMGHQFNGGQMQQHQNQFQPSAAQPLSYPNYGGPNYGGYYGHQQQQFTPSFQNQGNYMPQHNMGLPPPPPQMPAFAPPPPPPPPQPAVVNPAPAQSVSGDSATDEATEQGEEEQFSGQVSDRLDEWMKQVKEKPTQGPAICTKLASYMSYQIEQGFNTAELDYSIKEYPPLKNVPTAWAPELESDIFGHTRFQNNKTVVATEVALKSIQRGIASSLNALGPLTEIIMRQAENNPQLDDASTAVLDIIKFLSNSLGGITKKRRDFLKPTVDGKYHQRLAKKDEDYDPRFLFGGNVGDRVRKYKAADSLMKDVMKPETKSHNGQRRAPSAAAGSSNSNSQGSRSNHRSQPYNRQSGSNSAPSRSNNNQKPRQDFRNKGPHQSNNNSSNSNNRNYRS